MSASSEPLKFDIKADDLCQRLGGGLPRGTLIVLEGPLGAGKSVLCQRITQGLLKHEARVGYVSTELTTNGMFAQMDSLGYDQVWNAIPSEKFVFIPTHPSIGERSPRGDGLERLLRARRIWDLDVIIFDTFSKILADHMASRGASSMDGIEAVLTLFKRLTGQGRTIILTLDTEEVAKEATEVFAAGADIFIRLEKERVGTTTSRRIVVERMSRAARRYNETIGFRVEPRVGIVIEIRAVVG
jgi:flagellar protein FlaH